MDRRTKRARYVTGAGAQGGTYRMQPKPAKKKRKRDWKSVLTFLLGLVLALVFFYLLWSFLTRERGRASIGRAVRIGASASQNVAPFGNSVVFYDGTTLHCVSAQGGNEWSYQIGTNADYHATDSRIVAWSGNDLYILNERGRLTYNNKMSDTIQFAVAGEENVAVFSGDADEGVVTVINAGGQTVDNIAVSNLTLEDIGFFKAQTTSSGAGVTELMWMLGLNTTGTVIETELQTFQPGRLSIGKKALGEHVAYRVYDDGSGNLDIVTTREILHYNYRGVEIASPTLIYGYTLQDIQKTGSQIQRLFIPAQEQTGNMTIDSVRLMNGQMDRMLHLPAHCMDVRLGTRAIYAFTQTSLYACRFADTTFTAYAMPVNVTAVLGLIAGNRAVIASGSEIYVVELPM